MGHGTRRVRGVLLMALIVGGKDTLNPAWLAERFPTEVRATASATACSTYCFWIASRSSPSVCSSNAICA